MAPMITTRDLKVVTMAESSTDVSVVVGLLSGRGNRKSRGLCALNENKIKFNNERKYSLICLSPMLLPA